MLAAQSVATRVEWERRRAEVTDEMMPVAIVDPFRLHVFGVPAWRVSAVVKRGSRAYPLDLVWVPMISSFLPPACPSCGSRATLVAARAGLVVGTARDPKRHLSRWSPRSPPWRWPPRRRRRRLRLHRLPRISRGAPGQLPGQLQLHGRRRMRHLLAVRPPSDLRVAPLRRAPPAVSPRKAVRLRIPARLATASLASFGNRCSTTRR